MQLVVNNISTEIEAREWLIAHKVASQLSWPEIGKLTSVASSTLSAFAAGTYGGRNGPIAGKVIEYRDRLANEGGAAADLPAVPEWYETETSARLAALLRWAQSGKIVLIVTAPGIGKTRTAQRFASSNPNVWLATMAPSTAGVSTMAIEVGIALGLGEIKGDTQQLSHQIKAHVRGKKGLIVLDEAQELTDKALNEVRGWHDVTGVGVALLGNETVIGQVEGRKSALAQISSRFSIKHVQASPMPGDIDALLSAWKITDGEQRAFLSKVAAMPGALREVTNTIEIAQMTAFGSGEPLTLAHLRDASRHRHAKIGL